MFTCRRCGKSGAVGRCDSCGYISVVIDGVYQLTDDPYIKLDGEGDRYIGYERVGEFYEGRNWEKVNPEMAVVCRSIIDLTGAGPLLDLGCGSGSYSVPLALLGANVIAADISNKMLRLLKEKALKNGCGLQNLTLCRMNALSLPLADSSVGGALINSVLHLISNPQRVIDELYRVLKPGGYLVLSVNSPGLSQDISDELAEINRLAYEISNEFHRTYWKYLDRSGIAASRLSWKFDQFEACAKTFGNLNVISVPYSARKTSTLADGFLHRMGGKGFSDQQNVDEESHRKAFDQAYSKMAKAYGDNFADTPVVEIIDGINLSVYQKLS